MKEPQVALCIVIHNEEQVLERCLQSIPSWINERYVVHDGQCHDDSIAIAKKFGCQVFVRPHIGEAEPHRVWLYNKVASPWILQLDADEFLSSELRNSLKKLTSATSVSCYSFFWPYWDGKARYLTHNWPTKKALFRKDRIQFLGFPHEEVRVPQEELQLVPYILEHRPNYNNFTWKKFFSKGQRWIWLHAHYYLLNQDSLPTFPKKTKGLQPHYSIIGTLPLVSLLWLPWYHGVGILINGGWKQGIPGATISLFAALYYAEICVLVAFLRGLRALQNISIHR